jgi:hypothetical protein
VLFLHFINSSHWQTHLMAACHHGNAVSKIVIISMLCESQRLAFDSDPTRQFFSQTKLISMEDETEEWRLDLASRGLI